MRPEYKQEHVSEWEQIAARDTCGTITVVPGHIEGLFLWLCLEKIWIRRVYQRSSGLPGFSRPPSHVIGRLKNVLLRMKTAALTSSKKSREFPMRRMMPQAVRNRDGKRPLEALLQKPVA